MATPELRSRYSTVEGIDWARMPVLRFGPNDVLQDADLEGRLDPGVRRRRRVNHIPSSEAFMEAARVGLGWALLPQQQAYPLMRAGEVVALDEQVHEVPLFWQRWRLESTALTQLTEAVVQASAELRK